MPIYKLIFNAECSEKYFFKYSFNKTYNIKLKIEQQKACVSFSMKTEYTFDDFFVSPKYMNDLLRDMLKKVSLIHSILFGEIMKIERIRLCINDIDSGECPADSPFMNLYSIIDEINIDLPDS